MDISTLQAHRVSYAGTTGFTCHKRLGEHLKAVKNGDQTNALGKHVADKHPNCDLNELKFKTQLIQSNIPHNTNIYIKESLVIEKLRTDPNVKTLNSKSEWNQSGLSRLTVLRS